ncbi:MAG: tRNA (N6-isopentenyl adenosine(37)-C2)-methylthiotransferase MiaB [Christensenellales bacterium]
MQKLSNEYTEKLHIFANEHGKRTYYIHTYGCQMNVHDSQKLSGLLEEAGFVQACAPDDADVVLFNTCCVRDHAEQRVFGNVGALKEKRYKPERIIALCGCMMQQEGMAAQIKKRFPHVDIVFGTHNMQEFPRLLYERLHEGKKGYSVWTQVTTLDEGIPVRRENSYSAYITIMYGCNNFCSYCIVPYVRGRERSRRMEDILSEARNLAQAGYKEITLLGQNVNSYGLDNNSSSFPELLYRLNDIKGLEYIRFMTSHPKDLSDALIRAMKECSNVCDALHLPVQSGSDRILEKMNRRYSARHYLDLLLKLRQEVPSISISTDFIVGFPGETEDDFEQTMELVRQARFSAAYTFQYSPRKGTPAAKMEQQLPKDIMKLRLDALNDTLRRIVKEDNQQFVGRELIVLCDGSCANNLRKGRATNGKSVCFDGAEIEEGQSAYVKITGTRHYSLKGTITQIIKD